MKKIIKAFSLIELLVVISIIGILAAVAMPIYTRYQYAARASSIVPIVDSIVNSSIQYAAVNGKFGNAFDLKLNTVNTIGPNTWGNIDATILARMSPYFVAVLVGDVSNTSCYGKYGIVGGYLNPTTLGIPTSLVPSYNTIWFECFYWNYNKTINKQCFYSWGSSSVAQSGDLIPGWTNLQTTTGCCFGSNAVLLATPSYVNATCQ